MKTVIHVHVVEYHIQQIALISIYKADCTTSYLCVFVYASVYSINPNPKPNNAWQNYKSRWTQQRVWDDLY